MTRIFRQKANKKKANTPKKKEPSPLLNILLLGVGSVGKSTVAKQMRVIHRPYTKLERNKFGMILKQNLLEAVQLFLKAHHLEDMLGGPQVLQKYEMSANVSREMIRMWKDSKIQALWAASKKSHQFSSTCEYALSNFERIMAADFVPTDDDIIHAQIKTTGVSEYLFEAEYPSRVQFNFIDTGGEPNQRRKWTNFMEQSVAVVYVAALDVYDEMDVVDFTSNAMQDSMETFWEVSNIPELKDKLFVLYLNKRDKFEQKLSRSPLEAAFPAYKGGRNVNKAIEFIGSEFRKGFEGQEMYIYNGNALESSCCKETFNQICRQTVDRFRSAGPR